MKIPCLSIRFSSSVGIINVNELSRENNIKRIDTVGLTFLKNESYFILKKPLNF